MVALVATSKQEIIKKPAPVSRYARARAVVVVVAAVERFHVGFFYFW